MKGLRAIDRELKEINDRLQRGESSREDLLRRQQLFNERNELRMKRGRMGPQ